MDVCDGGIVGRYDPCPSCGRSVSSFANGQTVRHGRTHTESKYEFWRDAARELRRRGNYNGRLEEEDVVALADQMRRERGEVPA
jgi:hypothetical protein